MATLQPQSVVSGHKGRITAMAAAGPVVYTGGDDGAVIAWDLEDLTPSVIAPPDGVSVVALDIGGPVLASLRADATLGLEDGLGGPRRELAEPGVSLALDNNAAYVAIGGGPVQQFSLPRLEPRGAFTIEGSRCVAAGHGLVAVGDDGGNVVVFDGDRPRLARVANERGPVTAVAIVSPHEWVSGGSDGLVQVWRGDDGSVPLSVGAPVTALAARHFGGQRVVASGHTDGKLVVVVGDQERTITWETGTEPVAAVALVDLGGQLAAVTGGPDGRLRRWDVDAPAGVEGPQSDKVEWLTDAPADEDLLRRRPLARALARRLDRIRASEPGRSFLIHIDGAWGTGKSTIMHYLGQELEREWLVVDFNAWRRSRVGPPWWALLVALRDAVARRRGPLARLALRIGEAFARVRRTGGPYLLAIGIVIALAAAVVLVLKPSADVKDFGDWARSIAAVLGGLGTLWAGGLVAARLLLWDSAKGARVYEQSESDPMEHVVEHFAWLVRRADRPILFFVDDLDRCSGDYVVDLLEAVQTLVRDAPGGHGTYFVVAADGSWVRASYERRYEDFKGSVGEPGRPLGYLFLDKLFQLTVRVPAVSELDQAHYLAGLLGVRGEAPDVEQEVVAAKRRLKAGQSDAEVVAVLEDASPAARENLREAAIERLSDEGVQVATEHALERFAELLEPNPRAMKRFVNAFGLARVVLTLEDVLLPFDVLALWTILSTRWPMLADRLSGNPKEIELVGTDPEGVPEDVRALLRSPEVEKVVKFADGGPLTRELVELCVTGRAR